MQEEFVSCRGINGSVILSKNKMTVIGVGLGSAQAHDIRFGDVFSVVVERKSVVPFATVMILAIIVLVIANYNLPWFLISLYGTERLITPAALAVVILCGIPTVLRLMFVNITVRSRSGPLLVRLVPSRSAKRLARRFSEISARN